MLCLSDISSQCLPEPSQQNSSVSSIHLWFLCSPHSLTRDSHFIQGWQTDFTPEQLEKPAGFPSSDKTRPDSPVPTLHPEGPRHLHRIPRLSEAPWQVP